MGRKRRILIAALLAALLGALAWQISRPREPMYQGKPLSYWLEGFNFPAYNHDRGVIPNSDQAREAVRQLGTNAIPTILRLLQAKDPPWKINLLALLQRQHVIRINYHSPEIRQFEAYSAVEALQPGAYGAVPALIQLFDRNVSPESQASTAMSLGAIGPPASNAVPALIKGMTNTNLFLKLRLIAALGEIHSEPELTIPALIACLSDPLPPADPLAVGREFAIKALSAFGANARPAVPPLVSLLNDSNRSVRKAATNALLHIDPEAAAQAGVK